MSILVLVVYAIAFALLLVTGHIWCLVLAALPLSALVIAAGIAVNQREASDDSAEYHAQEFGIFAGDRHE